jgi:hypothetical protein
MEKSNKFNVVKEVVRDVLLILFVCFILVFPFALIWVGMWLEVIFN